MEKIKRHVRPLDCGVWQAVEGDAKIKLKRAGHILGSAYVEVEAEGQQVVFSGDLGAPHAPLLYAPQPPYRADLLVLESTLWGTRYTRAEGRGSGN